MPRDVSTRWNSTFDILAFAPEYKTAIDDIAGNKAANLRQYELSDEEWRIAEQLHDTLKVGTYVTGGFASSVFTHPPRSPIVLPPPSVFTHGLFLVTLYFSNG